MSFLTPLNFLFAGLIGAILLLYVLRLKRKERVISSTLLWQSALRDLQANAPWQRLRSSLLMWLQIAFLTLAVIALARPAVKVWATGGQTVAIILDASGSMAATDVSPSRFEKARAEASRLIGAMASGDNATIIASGAQTRVLAPLTADKNVLKRALANASTQDTGCNLRESIVLASSLLRGKKNPQIYVLSDGAVAPIRDLSLGTMGVQFVRIGQRNDNLAITAMDVRRGFGASSAPQIFVTVHNYGSAEKKVNLELSHNGDLVVVRLLTIPAADAQGPGKQSQLFENLNFKEGLFSIRFDADDDLKTDNVAYASLLPPRSLKVLLLSSGNPALEKALNLDPNVHVDMTAPGDAAALKNIDSYDVVVCDGTAPTGLKETNQLVFNTATSLSPITKVGAVQQPSVADWDHKHPVVRYANWNDVHFAVAQAVQLKPWGEAIVEAERTPLVVSGERGGHRVVWCGFDLRDTDLWLKVAFPVFITNTLHWLTAARGAAAAQEGTVFRAGDSVPLFVPSNTNDVTVTGPDKRRHHLMAETPPLLYSGADRVGIYTASAGSGKSAWQQQFAVNLLNKTESDLKPRDALQIGTSEPITAESRARSNRELWGYVALFALLLLGLEWWVYHRGV